MRRIEERRIGKYRILGTLGRGGSSVVYLAEDPVLKKKWAIKAIPRAAGIQLKEAWIMKNLDHPGLPRITEQIDEDKYCYLVMDYCAGVTLDVRCRKKPASRQEVTDWGVQLCEILGYLHSQEPPIIYRDMKPGNLILGKHGRLKLVDFGIARNQGSREKDACGTRGFAAPEQYEGKCSMQSDFYNLGATLRWTMQGKRYGELERLLKKCTRKEPEKRYTDSKVLKAAFLECKKKRNRRKRLGLAALTCPFLILILMKLYQWESNDLEQEVRGLLDTYVDQYTEEAANTGSAGQISESDKSVMLGEVYWEMGGENPKNQEEYYRKGISSYEKALHYTKEEWKQERIRMNIASLSRLLKDYEKAEETYETILQKNPESVEAAVAYGWMELTERKNTVHAKAIYEQLCKREDVKELETVKALGKGGGLWK